MPASLIINNKCDLRALLGSTLPTPKTPEVSSWFEDIEPLRFDCADLIRRVDAWAATVGSKVHEHELSMAGWLRSRAAAGQNIVVANATYRERYGGRRMTWVAPSHRGRFVLSKNGGEALAKPRFLLQSTPRAVRPSFYAAPGRRFVDVDIRACHPAAAAAVADDPVLRADLAGDIHQTVGDLLALGSVPDPLQRRKTGKAANSLMLCGGSWGALKREYISRGVVVEDYLLVNAWDRWWDRYKALGAVHDVWCDETWGMGLRNDRLPVVRPDGTPFSFSAMELVGGAKIPRFRDYKTFGERLAAAQRSSFSAIWRAVESAIMDRALALLAPLRPHVRLVLPMYDGLLLQVAERDLDALVPEVRGLVERACREAGVIAEATTKDGATWPM